MHTPALKVAIQGDPASFHEIAANNYYKQPISIVYCRTFQDVFQLLKENAVDRAFVAVRNTSHGQIDEVQHLLRASRATIEGEHHQPIQQHVVGLPDAHIDSIKTVISHPIALSQCSVYLREDMAHVQQQEYYDTSAAVAYIKHGSDTTVAAIGSEMAAELHGLKILVRSIQDDPENTTVFQSLLRAES